MKIIAMPTPLRCARQCFGIFLALCALASGCTLNLGQDSPYGNYGGAGRASGDTKKQFSIADTSFNVRWFPTYVRYSPDDKNLLVSLCHTVRPNICRIGRYHIASKHWEILPFEERRTYSWPTYTPDGKWIVLSTGTCDQSFNCPFSDYNIARMPADGSRLEMVADVVARDMSFSPDGKKLLYWRFGPAFSVKGRAVTHSELYEMDWETHVEKQLTRFIPFQGEDFGYPKYLDDGNSFVFNGRLDGPRPGGFSGFMKIAIADAPVYERGEWNKIKLIWKDPLTENTVGASGLFDATKDGRLLYRGDLGTKKAAGIATVSKIARNEGGALFLKLEKSDAIDEAAFDVRSCFVASLSSNAQSVAFVEGSPIIFHPSNGGLGQIRAGQNASADTFIEWPRLEIKSGAFMSFAR